MINVFVPPPKLTLTPVAVAAVPSKREIVSLPDPRLIVVVTASLAVVAKVPVNALALRLTAEIVDEAEPKSVRLPAPRTVMPPVPTLFVPAKFVLIALVVPAVEVNCKVSKLVLKSR